MKTSLDLPDELYRRVKSKSALEGRAVREVATALFTAWVDGREPVEPDAPSTDEIADTSAISDTSNPTTAWLEKWRELGTQVSASHGKNARLVDQLNRDRK